MSRIFSGREDWLAELDDDAELAIALAQIERGCIAHRARGECVMVFKESPEKVAGLRAAEKITTEFVLVERREFPSVEMDIEMETLEGGKLLYNYFFLTESPDEISFLETLRERGFFFLFFSGEGQKTEIGIRLEETEKQSLERILAEAGPGTDYERK